MALTKRELNLKTRYGLTVQQFDELLRDQAGMCFICHATSGNPNVPGSHLYVDHDHQTNAIRGLLCRDCNTALGLLRDDPERLQRANDYLSRKTS